MIKIDSDVPMPNDLGRRGKRAKYPLKHMDIGDSFFIAGATSRSISGIFYPHKPKVFSARAVVENEIKGVRIWRTA